MSLLEELADLIAGLPPRRVRVAVDCVDGAGKSTFAAALAAVVRRQRPVVESTVDGSITRARSATAAAAAGFFEDSYDYRAPRRCLTRRLPERHATVVVDNTDVTDPRVMSI